MKKKILSKSLLIFSIMMIIGIFSSVPSVNAASKASISCSGNVKVGSNFTVTLNLPADAYDANCDITVKYSDGTTKSGKITYVNGFQGYDSKSISFSATVAGNVAVTATNIYLNDKNGKVIEDGGSTSTTLKIEAETPPPTPTTPDQPSDSNNNNNNNNNNKPAEVSFTDVNEAVFTNDRVNLRKSYSTSSEKITTLDKNTKLTRTGVSSNGWSRVTYNGQTGYIYSQYLTKDSTPTENPNEVKFTDVNETVYTNDRVNLRKSYSTSSDKITTLDKNTKLTRTGVSSNGWSRVTYDGQTAYIYSKYLTKDDNSNENPDEKDVKITEVNEIVYAKQNCNLRKSWNTKSDKVGYLKKGQEITRTGTTDNGWSRVKYEGKDVFVLSTLITKEKTEEEEPNEEEPEQEEPQVGEKTELQILQEEIGVLPEVGNNIATNLYLVITTITLIVALGGIYYINKKDVK